MFQSINWYQFILCIAICMVVYYSVIMLVYYRQEILRLFNSAQHSFSGSQNVQQNTGNRAGQILGDGFLTGSNSNKNNNPESEEHLRLFPLIHELTEELKQLIQKAVQNKFKKEELLFALQQQLKQYAELKCTNFQTGVNDLIAVECENECSIHLSEDELRTMWIG